MIKRERKKEEEEEEEDKGLGKLIVLAGLERKVWGGGLFGLDQHSKFHSMGVTKYKWVVGGES